MSLFPSSAAGISSAFSIFGCHFAASSWGRIRSLSNQTQTQTQTQIQIVNQTTQKTPTQTITNDNKRERKKKQQLLNKLPWLLLSSPSTPETRYLYDVTLGASNQQGLTLNREIHLPDIADEIIIGSSQGFLLSIAVSPSPTIHATNPLTGAHLIIPPPSLALVQNLSDITDISKKPDVEEIIKIWRKPREKAYIDDIFSQLFRAKLALSPSLDKILVLDYDGILAFARLAGGDIISSSSSSSWTQLPDYWDDFIFHNGLLYTITGYSSIHLAIFDLEKENENENENENGPHVCHSSIIYLPPGYEEGESGMLRLSLVESPDKKHLFLVLRGKGGIDEEFAIRPDQTNYCKVFKLVKQKNHIFVNKWRRVRSLGDIAMFVGTNSSSVALYAPNFPNSLNPNSLYFSDSWDYLSIHGCNPDQSIGDAGVYNLEDGGIQFFQLSDGPRQLNWPPPVWYLPN